MKKKLLFVMPGLAAGGGEKSLINMLSHIDYEQFEVDLYLFNHEGLFMDYLPKETSLLVYSIRTERFRCLLPNPLAPCSLASKYG